jgi:hypothetical protein
MRLQAWALSNGPPSMQASFANVFLLHGIPIEPASIRRRRGYEGKLSREER